MASLSDFSFMPLLGGEATRSPSFSDSTFQAFAHLAEYIDSSVIEEPSEPATDESQGVAPPSADDTFLRDDRRLSVANSSGVSADLNASCLNAEIVYKVGATPVPVSSTARLLSTAHIDVINTACMLEDQIRDMEKVCAAAEGRCAEKRKRIEELETQLATLTGRETEECSDVDPFEDPNEEWEGLTDEHGVCQEMRDTSGRVNPVKRAIGLGLEGAVICETPDGKADATRGSVESEGTTTINGLASPTVSSLVHQELRNSYLQASRIRDGVAFPRTSGPTAEAEVDEPKSTRSSSFRNMLGDFAKRQKSTEGTWKSKKARGTLRRMDIDIFGIPALEDGRRRGSSISGKNSIKRSFTRSLRSKMTKSLGRQRSSPKRMPLMESSALKAFLKNSKAESAGSVKSKGTWRKRRGSLQVQDKENVAQTAAGKTQSQRQYTIPDGNTSVLFY
ncbi:hypothetical protein GLOTRDRAFT_128849 [Gloeophyllum trabeum ATCC 11539]|uniref:Uncharacterized protein n=1 Tax=Gloeophyllum trabeum (strain ATCC 11539 / FP-39264 / Madison 617) TaxID=670483 RepID=S7Q857_GLOTA|nr:uncharacterized protein GLOTRDRAFT_128849 [Gloeophyllum trabeum ATCC 11539]EPQ55628.1 hypothetical protein GLOTRDRAFT_128849 [Gloeophyllum trabeum ATCC 11539]